MTLLTSCSWGHFIPVFRVYFSKKVLIKTKIGVDDQRLLLPLKTVMFKTFFPTESGQCIFWFSHFCVIHCISSRNLVAFFFFREMGLSINTMEESMQPNMNTILSICIGGTFGLMMNIFHQVSLTSVLWPWVQLGKLRNFWFCFRLMVWGNNFLLSFLRKQSELVGFFSSGFAWRESFLSKATYLHLNTYPNISR